MRTLMITKTPPWPRDQGGRIRTGIALDALAQLGEVDLFLLRSEEESSALEAGPGNHDASQTVQVPFPTRQVTAIARIRSLIGGPPLEVAGRDYRKAIASLNAFATGHFDLVWVYRAQVFAALSPAIRKLRAPCVLDLDNPQAPLIRSRTRVELRHGVAGTLKAVLMRANARRWTSLEKSIAHAVDAVLVCSESDRERMGLSNCHVVPNTYPRPEHPVGLPNSETDPVLMLTGSFQYSPNSDAARFLVEKVLPLVRQRLPSATLRLVGTPSREVTRLAQPGVVMVGHVPDITVELSRAAVAVVPIRFGGGTRLKILEAFSHWVPVVSTTLGAYGLDVKHDVHLLLADTPTEFADACVRLLTTPSDRARLAGAANGLFLERHQTTVAIRAIHELVRGLLPD